MPVGFNDQDLSRFVSDKKVAPGKHALVCVAAVPHRSEKNDHIMVKLTWRILKDATDPNSITGLPINEWATFPLDNLAVEGHKAPDYAKNFAAFAMPAIFPDDVPAPPSYDKATGLLTFKGEVLDPSEKMTARLESFVAAGKKCAELWGEDGENVDGFVDAVVFAEVTYQKDSNFPSIRERYAVCPDSWELAEEATAFEALPAALQAQPVVSNPTPRKRGTKRG